MCCCCNSGDGDGGGGAAVVVVRLLLLLFCLGLQLPHICQNHTILNTLGYNMLHAARTQNIYMPGYTMKRVRVLVRVYDLGPGIISYQVQHSTTAVLTVVALLCAHGTLCRLPQVVCVKGYTKWVAKYQVYILGVSSHQVLDKEMLVIWQLVVSFLFILR